MVSKKDQDLAVVTTFTLLSILAIIAGIILFFISMFRFLFWVSLIGILVSFIFAIFFSISWFANRNNSWDNDDSGMWALISIVAIFVLYILAGLFYNGGYSDTAIQTEMSLKGYLEWYGEFINIPHNAIEGTINNLCQDPNYPCKEVRQGYVVYQNVAGLKGFADKFSRGLVTAKKIESQF